MSTARERTYQASRKTYAETGMRSGLEVRIKDSLDTQGCPFLYEPVRIPYNSPSHYIPDFVLEKQGIIIEGKGEFKSSDRRKLLLVKKAHPDLDIRLVFSRSSTKIGKKSTTTYGMWCKRNGFPYADGDVPGDWITHKPTKEAKEALRKLLGVKASS